MRDLDYLSQDPKIQAEIAQFMANMEAIANRQTKPETVDHPDHYNSLPAVCPSCGNQIECIDVVRHKDFNTGNAMKYIWRAGFKHEPGQDPRDAAIQDLEKAVWYLQDEIELLRTQRSEENANRES